MAQTRYVVLGAGRQGAAIGYDLAVHGDAADLVLADADLEVARSAAARVNRLVGRDAARAAGCDVARPHDVGELLAAADVAVSAVPYRFNVDLARVAVETRTSFTDLGGNTDIVKQELALDAEARRAGVAVVPDLGLAPGMGNILAAWAVERLDEPRHVTIRCGGLPQNPRPPLFYKLVFSVHGLTNEYAGEAIAIVDGEVVRVPTLTGIEPVDVPGVGRLEAAVTSGGTSTCPETFAGRLESYDYKTLRYPGHWQIMAAAKALGLLGMTPIEVGGTKVVPREVLHRLIEQLATYDDEDLVVLRVAARGRHEGRDATLRLDIVDRQDRATGFTAMERTTGYPTSIVAILMGQGRITPGARPPELAVPGADLAAALAARGLAPVETFT